jgi:hypothetical protein
MYFGKSPEEQSQMKNDRGNIQSANAETDQLKAIFRKNETFALPRDYAPSAEAPVRKIQWASESAGLIWNRILSCRDGKIPFYSLVPSPENQNAH